MQILLLSRYGQLGASSRIRTYQFIPYLESVGHEITVAALLDDDYIRSLYGSNARISFTSVIKSYLARLGYIQQATRFDLIWVEKEMFPWLPGWLETGLFPRKTPLVVDYDDAVFHRYDQHQRILVRVLLGKKIDAVMRRADLVIVGNDYLARRAQLAGAGRIEYLPTSVDLERYQLTPQQDNNCFSVGWIGTPVTERYLEFVQPALSRLCKEFSRIKLILVGSRHSMIHSIPLQFRDWSEDTEVSDICDIDTGIMPLPEEPWECGKCGYKLIQYMACAKPVIASPVGINAAIVEHGVNGFLCRNDDEWYEALRQLYYDKSLRTSMGLAGRKSVESRYCLQVTAPRLASLLESVGGK